MNVGDRAYRVRWRGSPNWVPYIDTGRVEASGKKGNGRKVKWREGATTTGLGRWGSRTMAGAIRNDINRCCEQYCGIQTDTFNPMKLAKYVGQLMRLYRKLEKHHLV